MGELIHVDLDFFRRGDAGVARDRQRGGPRRKQSWFFRTLCDVQFGLRTRTRSKSSLARPYICRLRNLSRLTCPSTWPLLHCDVKAARTADKSALRPAANRRSSGTAQSLAWISQRSKPLTSRRWISQESDVPALAEARPIIEPASVRPMHSGTATRAARTSRRSNRTACVHP